MATHCALRNPRRAPSGPKSVVLNLLFRTTARRHRWPYRLFWHRLYARTREWTDPIATTIHGRRIILNANYTYPLCSRMFPCFNNPLIELVHETFRGERRPLHFVDVGAAIGDTVLLVDANCANMVSHYTCIDGDEEFFDYLTLNLGTRPNCRLIHKLLSSCRTNAPELIRTHGGTSSAQGITRVPAEPLDDVLADAPPVDVLKIDVDGFDGEVLAGAATVLQMGRPAVIFEWHPKLCHQTGNDPFRGFAALAAAGYERLVWYSKFGEFSHYTDTKDRDIHHRWERYCLETVTDSDCHFDIIAIPETRRISEQALTDLQFAASKRSPW